MSEIARNNAVLPTVQSGGWPVVFDPHLDFVTPQLKHVLEVWQAKRGTRTMPSRADMTLKDLKSVLPNLAFMAIVREGGRQRFMVRLMGGTLDTYLTPMTGRFVDEAVPAHFVDKWASVWQPAIDGRTPVRSINRVEYGERRWHVAEAFYAPLAGDGETPDMLMTAAYYHTCNSENAPPSAIVARLTNELGDDARMPTA